MAVNLSPIGGVAGQFFDNNGNPLAGGKIFTYAAGTTTNQATYTSASGIIAHSNPIILDAAGRVPGGEIWLTDGLQYKFVIKTSTDVLIGTYDNIVGINSNFINFLTETEIQTATAGQTVFTLTTMQYQPNTNSLSVFVDGVNQYDGVTYAYTETSSTVVTFTAGLHVGALVKFTTAQTLSSGVTDASLVTYDPPFTGSVPTNVENKLAETVSVKDFGAVGDGIADDTAAIQAAIDYGVASKKSIYFPSGTYLVSNLTFGDTSWFGEDKENTIIKAKNTGDSGYMVASISWINNYSYISGPIGVISDLTFDADLNKENCVVLRAWNTTFNNCFIRNSTKTDLLISTDGRGGAVSIGSMVNNVIKNCWIGYIFRTTEHNVKVVDTALVSTDLHFLDNYISGATIASLETPIASGWNIQGNHFYDAPYSAIIARPTVGTTCVDNLFENKVKYGSFNAGFNPTFGPGNYCIEDVLITFFATLSDPDTLVSLGNTFGPNAHLVNAYFGPEKLVISHSDVFVNLQPFQFNSNETPNPSSPAVIKIVNSVIAQTGRVITATITGATAATGSYLRCPASWDDLNYASPGTLNQDNYNGYYPRIFKKNNAVVGPLSALDLDVDVPDIYNGGGYKIVVYVTTAQFTSGPTRTTYKLEGHLVNKTGTYYLQKVAETYTAGEWSVAPTITVSVTGAIATVNFAGTVSTTDGFGHCSIEVSL